MEEVASTMDFLSGQVKLINPEIYIVAELQAPDCAQVTVHTRFVQAPVNVELDLCCDIDASVLSPPVG